MGEVRLRRASWIYVKAERVKEKEKANRKKGDVMEKEEKETKGGMKDKGTTQGKKARVTSETIKAE